MENIFIDVSDYTANGEQINQKYTTIDGDVKIYAKLGIDMSGFINLIEKINKKEKLVD